MILVELRCGENSGKCGRLFGRVRRTEDGRYLAEDRDGNGTETDPRDLFGFPTCSRHLRQITLYGTRDGGAPFPIKKGDVGRAWLDLTAEVFEAERTGRTVTKVVIRSDFRDGDDVVDVSDLSD